MKKYLIALALVSFLCLPAYAETNEHDEDEIEVNAFGYPENNLVKVIENPQIKKNVQINAKPDCGDKRLAKQAQEALKPLIEREALKISDRRKIKLLLKNIDNFFPLPAQDISPNKNKLIAGKLIELKINRHIDAENIVVCQTDNPVLNAKLYLILYDDGDFVKVDIVNFDAQNEPSFIFRKD